MDEPARRYTVDTLTHFRGQSEAFADLFFVLGTDSWAEIATWRAWEELITLANLIVVTRPGVSFSAAHMGEAVVARVVDLRGLANRVEEQLNLEPARPKIFVTDAVMSEVSATQVRAAARDNPAEDLGRLVPPEVANYIRKYGLYRIKNEQSNG
jgi:nicotinate-nucleotide adenylyltransferase